jgi:hypothetical protein
MSWGCPRATCPTEKLLGFGNDLKTSNLLILNNLLALGVRGGPEAVTSCITATACVPSTPFQPQRNRPLRPDPEPKFGPCLPKRITHFVCCPENPVATWVHLSSHGFLLCRLVYGRFVQPTLTKG